MEQIAQSWALHESKSAIQVHAVSVFMSSQKRDRLPDLSLKLSVSVALMEIAARTFTFSFPPSWSGYLVFRPYDVRLSCMDTIHDQKRLL